VAKRQCPDNRPSSSGRHARTLEKTLRGARGAALDDGRGGCWRVAVKEAAESVRHSGLSKEEIAQTAAEDCREDRQKNRVSRRQPGVSAETCTKSDTAAS